MGEPRHLTLHETTPRANWPAGRMPEWVDEGTRLYTGFELLVAAHRWREIVVAYDGSDTTAYVTANGFDMGHHGPAIHAVRGKGACYRRVVREWFRAFCSTEVTFE